jgi:O-methyltransferase
LKLGARGERRYIKKLNADGRRRAFCWPFTAAWTHQCWTDSIYAQFNWSVRRSVLLGISRFCELNGITNGYYFEFGCHRARTFRLAYDAFSPLHDFTYVAFDSFAGLPDVTGIDVHDDLWYRGQMCTSEPEFRSLCKGHGIPEDDFRTVKGFYVDSLTPELVVELGHLPAAVVYIDCDLYSSTVPVLNFVKKFLRPGTVIIFDDWFLYYGDPDRGERRAFAEFCAANPRLRFEPFLVNHESQSFIYIGET